MTQGTAIQLAPQQAAPLALSVEQESLIRDMYGNGASDVEFAVFLEVCRARRLNPLTRQIHFVSRWDSERQKNMWTAQVSIDGLRTIAERTGKYDGQDEPEFEYDDKKRLVLARVRVYRKDWTRPAVGVARFDEYAGKKRDGGLTMMWATKGHIMIAKCAEALALRKAFPEDLSGLYVSEEMGEAEPKRGTSVAHQMVPDGVTGDSSVFETFDITLKRLEGAVELATTYDECLRLRAELGSKAAPSELNKQIQAAWQGNQLSGDHYKAISSAWARTDRKLKKKTDALKPPVEASFIDAADPDPTNELTRDDEYPGREPGMEG